MCTVVVIGYMYISTQSSTHPGCTYVPECECRERCVPASKGGQGHGLLGLTRLRSLAYLQVSHGVLVEEPGIVATLQGGKEEWTVATGGKGKIRTYVCTVQYVVYACVYYVRMYV